MVSIVTVPLKWSISGVPSEITGVVRMEMCCNKGWPLAKQ